MASERQAAAYEPVIVRDAVFYVERVLDADGEILVRPGDRVEPAGQLASAMVAEGRPLLLNIAREFDMEPEAVSRYLTRPVGSEFEEGEPIARARRGLRSVTCRAPVSAPLMALDEATGVATLVPQSHPQQLSAAVYGEVESVIERRGVSLRVGGSRVDGIIGLGRDTYGPLKVAVDRADRELTADMVDSDFRQSIVLAGMTLGTSALRKLIEVGARGVIVGSISDSEVRRYLAMDDREPSSMILWRRMPAEFTPQHMSGSHGLTVFVTEGFGRRRMAQPVFQFLSGHENQIVSLLIPRDADVMSARPALYVSRERPSGDEAIQRVAVRDGTLARLTDPEHLAMVVTCRSGVTDSPGKTGVLREVVDVEFSNGTRTLVPATSLEVLIP
ncbi:MAG: hypothetical protein WD401_06595 [Thermomicrobiaceae bacterium]